jgi:hypothetical protein
MAKVTSTMGTRSSKIVHAPATVTYSDAAMIGQNYEKQKAFIEAVYAKQKKEVRFVAETKENPYLTVVRDNTRITVVYNKVNNWITDICHE